MRKLIRKLRERITRRRREFDRRLERAGVKPVEPWPDPPADLTRSGQARPSLHVLVGGKHHEKQFTNLQGKLLTIYPDHKYLRTDRTMEVPRGMATVWDHVDDDDNVVVVTYEQQQEGGDFRGFRERSMESMPADRTVGFLVLAQLQADVDELRRLASKGLVRRVDREIMDDTEEPT